MSRTSKAFMGLLSTYGLFPLRLGVQLIIIPLVLSAIGSERMGLWYIAAELIAYLNLIEAGNGLAATRFTAVRFAEDAEMGVSTIISSLFFLNLLLGLFLLVVCMPLAPWVSRWYELPPHLSNDFLLFFLWVVVWVSMRFVLNLFPMSLRGFQDMVQADFAAAIGIIGKLIFIIFAIRKGAGLLSLIWGEYVSVVLEMLASLYFLKKRCPKIQVRPKLIRVEELRNTLRYSLQLFSLSIPSLITLNTTSMIIAKLFSPVEVTVFNLTVMASKQARGLLTAATPVMFPGICELYGRNDLKHIRTIFLRFIKPIIAVNLAAFFSVTILNDTFVAFWVGKDSYAGIGTTCFYMLWCSAIAMVHPLIIFMRAEGNLRGLIAWAHIEAGLAVSLSIYFGLNYGLCGISLALLISHLLTTHQYLWRWGKAHLGFTFSEILSQCGSAAIKISFLYLLLAFIHNYCLIYLSLRLTLLTGMLMCSSAGLLSLLLWGLTTEDRERIRDNSLTLISKITLPH